MRFDFSGLVANDPQLIYIALVLPTLFALTFVAEGVHKLMKNEPPWIPLFTGLAFITVIIITYFLILK